mgnify:CR=1 FL=1
MQETSGGGRVTEATEPRPLDGLRIIDLSLFVAGPFGTALLADLGAEVIKVEPPGGDPIRHNRVGPQIGDVNAQFHTYNRGKSSVELDLKSSAGKRVLYDLCTAADAVFDNFRPGVMERLELDHATLVQFNPTLVSVSLSAFGHQGPWAKRPGYDLIVQALGGGMSITGHPETGPAHIPFHLGDTAGGLYSAVAILAAVLQARSTGSGRAYEVSMLDAQLSLLGDEITNNLTGNWANPQHGAGHPGLSPYSAYETADDPIVVAAVGVEKFWRSFLTALGLDNLATDPRFSNNAERCKHRAELESILQPRLRARDSAHWLRQFEALDVPAAPVLGVGDAIVTPHAKARDLIATVDTGTPERAHVPVAPLRYTGKGPFTPTKGSPSLGVDSADTLQRILSYTEADLERLKTEGAFGDRADRS